MLTIIISDMTSAFKDKEGQRITYKTVKTESGLSIKCFHGSNIVLLVESSKQSILNLSVLLMI